MRQSARQKQKKQQEVQPVSGEEEEDVGGDKNAETGIEAGASVPAAIVGAEGDDGMAVDQDEE